MNSTRFVIRLKTKRSWSLLNTDQTPACFWITNPDNNFLENHAAGSDRYGYWYDLQKHAIGPHANTNVCPENERVGEFKDNHALAFWLAFGTALGITALIELVRWARSAMRGVSGASRAAPADASTTAWAISRSPRAGPQVTQLRTPRASASARAKRP